MRDWFKPSLSRYPGLHLVCSGFIPGGLHQNKSRENACDNEKVQRQWRTGQVGDVDSCDLSFGANNRSA